MIRPIAILFVLLSICGVAHAVPTVHYVSPTAAGAGDGSSWAAAANLHDAIANAAFGDELWLSTGYYHPSSSGDRAVTFNVTGMANLSIFGGFSGNGLETMLSERDWVAHPTILTGDIGSPGLDTDNSQTILMADAANLMLNGLIFERAYADGVGAVDGNAGAIYGTSSSWNLSVENCIFRNNQVTNASGKGAAIYQANSYTHPSHMFFVSNSVFENNSSGGGGAAIYTSWALDISSSVILRNSSTAASPGGLFFGGTSPGGNIVHTVIHDNTGVESYGQGVYGEASSTINIKNSILWNNFGTTLKQIEATGTINTNNSIVSGADYGTDLGGNSAADPMFSDNVNAAGADGNWLTPDDGLSLLAGSPAIDAGEVILGFDKDILGMGSVGQPDIGAYETPSVLGQALSFDGTDDYIEIPDAAANQWAGNISVGAWVRINATGSGERMIVAKYLSDGFYLGINASGNLEFLVAGGAVSDTLESPTAMVNDQWIHVAATYGSDNQKAKLFLNGVLIATKVISTGLDLNNGSSLRIGRSTHNAGGFFDGSIDEVVLFDRVITASKFSTLWTGSENGLRAYYDMNTGTGVTAMDGSTSPQDGTLTGGPTWIGSGGQPNLLPKVLFAKTTASGSGDAMSWANAGNLQDALAMAKENDEIWVATGSHFATSGTDRNISFTIGVNNISLYGGFNGSENHFQQRDPVIYPAIINGDIGSSGVHTDNTYTLMLINSANIIIDGFVFERGQSDGPGMLEQEGGAIYLSSTSSAVKVFNSIFRHNLAEHGGAVSNRNSASGQTKYLEFINCVFAHNTGNNSSGAVHTMGPTIILHSVFHNNVVNTNQGGAVVFNVAGSGAFGEVLNSTFFNNNATGATSHVWSDSSNLTVKNSIFRGGSSSDNLMVSTNGGGSTTISNCYIQGADSGSWPGATVGTDGGSNVGTSPQFFDSTNPMGADGQYFTHDDGLRLRIGSPAIDMGLVIPISNSDILGQSYVNAPDIGAYEGAAGIEGPALTPYPAFNPLAELNPYQTNRIALIFDLDTVSSAYAGNITDMVFMVSQADPSVELSSALVYDLTAGALVSNSAVIGSDNISFSGLNYPLTAGINNTLELKVTTASAFTGDNIHFSIQAADIKLEDNASISGNSIASGNIPLITPFEGLSFAGGPLGEPTEFPKGSNGLNLIDAQFNLINGSSFEILESIKIIFGQGFIGSDVANITLWSGGSQIGELDNVTSTTAANYNLGIAINGPTDIQVRADILPGGSSGNLDYSIAGSHMLLTGGNILQQPTIAIANIGPVVNASPTMLSVTGLTPNHGATDAPISGNLNITFDEPLSTLGAGPLKIYENGTEIYNFNANSPELMVVGPSLSIDPPSDLQPNANYHITIDANLILGSSGNTFAGFNDASFWSFSTGAGASGNATGPARTTRLALGQLSAYSLSPTGVLSGEGDNRRSQIDSAFGNSIYGATDFGPTEIDAIKSGAEHLLALKAGQLYVTGSNDFAQSQGYATLTPIAGINNIDLIEAGAYSNYAYDSTGDTLYVWGRNNAGQLGNGSAGANLPSPTGISKPAGNIQDMAAGVDHVLMIISGNLYGAGSDSFGQLMGTGPSSSLTLLDDTQTWRSVGAGGFHSFAINAAGNLYAFGKNVDGQLGLGTKSPMESNLSMLGGLPPVSQATGGYDHSMMLFEDGRVFTVGSNAEQQIGAFAGMESLNWFNVGSYNNVSEIACGPYSSMFITTNTGIEYVKLFGMRLDGPSDIILVFKSY